VLQDQVALLEVLVLRDSLVHQVQIVSKVLMDHLEPTALLELQEVLELQD